MSRARAQAVVAAALLLWPVIAIAGDPQAHTAAMLHAAQQLAGEDEFANGVGGPTSGTRPGLFQIFKGTSGEDMCPLTCNTSEDKDCPRSEVNGRAINAPDDWGCLSSEQSPTMIGLNARLAPKQAVAATVGLKLLSSQLAMACNYSHFKANPALLSAYSAPKVGETTYEWARKIVDGIRDGCESICGTAEFETYYRRVVNAIHYFQDMESEHHAVGNVACDENSGLGFPPGGILEFLSVNACQDFIVSSINGMTGTDPEIHCDMSVVDKPETPGAAISLNGDMINLRIACNGNFSLACMGMERVFRHHCKFPDVQKSIDCSGPRGDHSACSERYCEGEINSGGGQDFLSAATNVSVAVLREALEYWASVCTEPDDPCDTDQCTQWCKHQTLGDNEMGPDGPFRSCRSQDEVAGYCVNSSPDPTCVLHTCECAPRDACGTTGQRCCAGSTCNAAGDICSLQTGRCITAVGELCAIGPPPDPRRKRPPPRPPRSGRAAGDPHLLTFDAMKYDVQAVGELTLSRDTVDGTEVQVRTAAFTNSHTVTLASGVAARVGAHVVAFYAQDQSRLDHVATDFPQGLTQLDGGDVYRQGSTYTVVWPDNTQLVVGRTDIWLSVALFISDDRAGRMQGLLGNFDGDSGNDLVTRSGMAMARPVSFSDFYHVYVESWRVTQATSMFDYSSGQTTETFTDRSFPIERATTDGISDAERASASALCEVAGVTADWLDACVLDVTLTGDARFASNLASIPSPAAEIDMAGGLPVNFTGATVTYTERGPTMTDLQSRPASAVIGPGVEFTNVQNLALPGITLVPANIDVGASTIDIFYMQGATVHGGAFNGCAFEFSGDNLPPITGAVIDPATQPQLRDRIVTFNATTVFINSSGLHIPASSHLIIDILR